MSKVCCIVNCESKCPNLGPNKRMLFEFPKDSDVERTFRTVLKAGIINEIPREKFKLNQDSIPCIFDVRQDNFGGKFMSTGDKSLCVSTPLEGALPTQENEAIEYTIEALKRNFEAPEHSSETIE
ncbi:uncharacterized protein LOC105186707 isoform X3 [Harpegnathos saltator]|uniref:uncharacterized protein LOC105186707 isoform X3 n=1 Tax=Harpegnathos saltator TaxID=610380 RepID=UPI00058E8DD4|nr:uncharacterized protein LOC105186707 isoform X3 [Harpegnathos saltator]